jgi:hypothetical protein
MFSILIKKKATLLSFIFILTVLVSCMKDDHSPEVIAEKFLNHIEKAEFKEAKLYCDEKTASMIEVLESFATSFPKKDTIDLVEILSSEIKDDQATVPYSMSKKEEEQLTLKKVDGQWKISIDKENRKKEEILNSVPTDISNDSINSKQDSLHVE